MEPTQPTPDNALAEQGFDRDHHTTIQWMIAFYQSEEPLKAALIDHLWKHRAQTEKKGPLAAQSVYNEFGNRGLDSAKLSRFRPEILSESAAQAVADCPYAIDIGDRILRINFLDKRSFSKRELHLADLADYEHLGGGGYLSPDSELMIYIHQGSGIADRLPQLMLTNMEQGVRYRYFMPVEFAKHAAELIGELLIKMDRKPAEILPLFRKRLEVNLMAQQFPFFFSVHNSDNQRAARMYLRSLNSRNVVLYSERKEAYDSAQCFETLAAPVIRDDNPPVILPCQNVNVPQNTWRLLRYKLKQRLERLGVSQTELPPLLEHLIPTYDATGNKTTQTSQEKEITS